MQKFFRKAIAVAALVAVGSAHASAVLSFETPVDWPIVLHGQQIAQGDFWVQGIAPTAGLAGVLINGADVGDTCDGFKCPSNNTSNFYSAMDDGYLAFGRMDGAGFRVAGLDASFIGVDGVSYPGISGILLLQGWRADGSFLNSNQIALYGPTGGNFQFSSYGANDFGAAFASSEFEYVYALSYACNSAGSCNRNTNTARFALDNVVTANAVPEPSSYALLGLGLAAMAGVTRRRRQAA